MSLLSRASSILSWPLPFENSLLESQFQSELRSKSNKFHLVAGLAGTAGHFYFFALWAITRDHWTTNHQLWRLVALSLSLGLVLMFFSSTMQNMRHRGPLGPLVVMVSLMVLSQTQTNDMLVPRSPSIFAMCCLIFVFLSCPLWGQSRRVNLVYLAFVVTTWVGNFYDQPLFPEYLKREFIFILLACIASYQIALQIEKYDRQLFTQRLEIEQAKHSAETANRSKSFFLAAVSHDLRQPLTALSLWTERIPGLRDDTLRTQVGSEMSQSVNALRQMLDSLLDLSKLDAKAIQVDLQAVDLPLLLTSIAAEYQDRAQAKGITLEVQAAAPDLIAHSDPVQLARIVRNLCHNAVTYTQKGGVILTCALHGEGEIEISVSDTGIGIPLDQQARIFDEYYQVNNPGRDKTKGLGLGLSILAFRSEPSKGTHFSVFCASERGRKSQ
jgi:signal transduction histidine kinase